LAAVFLESNEDVVDVEDHLLQPDATIILNVYGARRDLKPWTSAARCVAAHRVAEAVDVPELPDAPPTLLPKTTAIAGLKWF
jgi:hypothetical protein